MSTKDLLDEAMKLKPEERFALVEGLIKSLDEPDKKLDEIWAEEAEKRLKAYRGGKLEGVPMEEIFRDKGCASYSPEWRCKNWKMPSVFMSSHIQGWPNGPLTEVRTAKYCRKASCARRLDQSAPDSLPHEVASAEGRGVEIGWR
jgi:putative addiction module component (TIGR02574 family)